MGSWGVRERFFFSKTWTCRCCRKVISWRFCLLSCVLCVSIVRLRCSCVVLRVAGNVQRMPSNATTIVLAREFESGRVARFFNLFAKIKKKINC